MHLIAGQDGEGKKWQVEQEQEQEQERGEEREVKKEWIALVSTRVGSVGSRRQARRQAFHLCLNMELCLLTNHRSLHHLNSIPPTRRFHQDSFPPVLS